MSSRTRTAYRNNLRERIARFEAEWAQRHLQEIKKDTVLETVTQQVETDALLDAVQDPRTN